MMEEPGPGPMTPAESSGKDLPAHPNSDGGERAAAVAKGATLFDPSAPNGKSVAASSGSSKVGDSEADVDEDSIQAARFRPLREAIEDAPKRQVLFKIESQVQVFLKDKK